MPMIIRYWINMIIMGLSAYASYRLLMVSYVTYEDMTYLSFLYLIAPWILLYSSVKSWRKLALWRRMCAAQYMPQNMGRGQIHSPRTLETPNILERGCIPLILLALAAILKEFAVPHIGLWIAILVGTWLIFGRLFRKLG